MKLLISTLLVGVVFTTFITDNANAFVCAHGVYRAGCVGRHGALGVHTGYYHRGVVHTGYYHRGVVVHRRVY